jgi:hypothetical protein
MYRSEAELVGSVMLCMGTSAREEAMKSKSLTLYVFAFSGDTKDRVWPTPEEVYDIICLSPNAICLFAMGNLLKMSLQAQICQEPRIPEFHQ